MTPPSAGDRLALLARATLARIVGRSLILISIAGFFVAVLYGSAGVKEMVGLDPEPFSISPALAPIVYLVGLGGFLVLGSIGLRVHRRGRQYRSRATRMPVPSDQPLVLYLRPFAVDPELARISRGRGMVVGSILTFEEQLCDAVRSVGSVQTVNRPGEDLPPSGAQRQDVDVDWRAAVLELLGRARLVVLILGASAGVRWEIEQAVRYVEPERLLLLTLGGEAEYNDQRAALGGTFPRGLANWSPGRPRNTLPISCAVRFDAAWTPSLTRLDRALVSQIHPFESAFVYSLRSLFDDLGASWPGVRAVRWAGLTSRSLRSGARFCGGVALLIAVIALLGR